MENQTPQPDILYKTEFASSSIVKIVIMAVLSLACLLAPTFLKPIMIAEDLPDILITIVGGLCYFMGGIFTIVTIVSAISYCLSSAVLTATGIHGINTNLGKFDLAYGQAKAVAVEGKRIYIEVDIPLANGKFKTKKHYVDGIKNAKEFVDRYHQELHTRCAAQQTPQ